MDRGNVTGLEKREGEKRLKKLMMHKEVLMTMEFFSYILFLSLFFSFYPQTEAA